MKPFVVIDIETVALGGDRLAEILPDFKAPGNYKDAAKVKEHCDQQAKDWLDRSALYAERGQILCAGVFYGGLQDPDILEGSEGSILYGLWSHVEQAIAESKVIVGHYVYGFDLPFMVRRSWALKVKVPAMIPLMLQSYYPPNEIFDTAYAWRLSNREDKISLDTLAWHLGVGRKNGNGANFAALYATDKPKAIEYLVNDLRLTRAVYETLTQT